MHDKDLADFAPLLIRMIDHERREWPFMRAPCYWDVLAFFMIHRKTKSLKNIAHSVGIDVKTAKRVLNEFRTQGLIVEQESSIDRRRKQYVLTREGVQKLGRFWQVLRESADADVAHSEDAGRPKAPPEGDEDPFRPDGN